jgi:CheY-like chemotaxis protein
MAVRILVIEDNELNIDVITRRLEKSGYATTVARTLVEAREKISEIPDAVLLDMLLPDGKGYDLAVEWKSSSKFRAIPIIGVSALAFEQDKTKAMDAGCDAYFVKPVNYQALTQAIDRLTGDKRESQLGTTA